MENKPEFLGPHHASVFQESGVVAAYRHRPPYPDAVFELLASLIVDEPRAILDLGCGPGPLARRLVEVAERVDAVDVSAAMIEAGRGMPNGTDPRVHWIVSRAEDAELTPPYALITAGSSMQWMDWDLILPRLSEMLTPGGVLVLVDNRVEPQPWKADLDCILPRYSTNPLRPIEYNDYNWIEELQRRGLFRRLGHVQTETVRFIQTVDDYVESFHSRSAFTRERLGAEHANAFDEAIRSAVRSYVSSDVELHVHALISWGKPLGRA